MGLVLLQRRGIYAVVVPMGERMHEAGLDAAPRAE